MPSRGTGKNFIYYTSFVQPESSLRLSVKNQSALGSRMWHSALLFRDNDTREPRMILMLNSASHQLGISFTNVFLLLMPGNKSITTRNFNRIETCTKLKQWDASRVLLQPRFSLLIKRNR